MNHKRRAFIISSFILSTYAVSPKRLISLDNKYSTLKFTNRNFNVANKIQNHLFPHGKNNPSIEQLNATQYLQKVLLDEDYDLEVRTIIFDGIIRIDQQSKNKFDTDILTLNNQKLERLIKNVSEDWGESFLAMIMLFIFEALFSDPIYGTNINEIGWKWINHIPGQPLANEYNKYRGLK